MSKNSKQMWAKVKAQIQAGDFPKVFVTRAGKLALDGSAAELPSDIADLYPEEIRAEADLRAATKLESDRHEHERHMKSIAEREAIRQAVIAEFGGRRVWRLSGLFVDDWSTNRYTWHELSDWLSWDAYNLRHNNASVCVVCERGESAGGDFQIDVSGHFNNPCNDRARTPSFELLATRLREYVQMRRNNASHNN